MRKRLWQLHSWLGLVCSVGLLAVGLSGSLLVFQDEFDALRRPSVYRATPTPVGRLPFDILITSAQRALPGWVISDWEVSPNVNYTDRLRAFPPQETREICKLRIDPYTGELRGVPATYSHTLSGFLLILHTEFFAGTAGAVVVGLLGTGFMLLGISGVWLYRGFWRNLLTLRWHSSARIFFSDLHKTVGISSVAFNLVVGFTGVWWTCERVYGTLAANGQAGAHSPVDLSTPFDLPRERVSLDALVAEAGRRLHGFRLTSISFPDKQAGEIILTGGVPSVNPLRSCYGSQVTITVPGGLIKEVRDIRRVGLGAQIYDMFAPLHYGTFGGWPIKLLWCLGGMAPGTLAMSGFLLWRARRKPAVFRTPVAPASID